MRVVYDEETDAQLKEYVRDYQGNDAYVEMLVNVGRFSNLTKRLEGGDYQTSIDQIGWSLSADFWGKLPPQVLNADVTLTASIGGIPLRVFEGFDALPTYDDENNSTNILADTPGASLGVIPLRNPVQYDQKTPEYCIRDAVGRIKGYDLGNVRIPRFDRPRVRRLLKDGKGFEDSAFPLAILDAMSELVSCSYHDTATGRGMYCERDVGTGTGKAPVWEYDEADDKQVFAWTEPSPATPDEQYTSVVGRARKKNGDLRFWEEAGVDYSHLENPPEAGRTKFLDLGNTEDEQLTRNEAYLMAADEALALANMLHYGSFDCSYNPFLEILDVLAMRSTHEDDTGLYSRLWRGVVESLAYPFAAGGVGTTVGVRAVLLRELRLPDPPIKLPGVSAQVLDFGEVEVLVRDEGRTVLVHDSAAWALDEGRTVLLSDGAPVTNEGRTAVVNR